jgi:RNA polymerase sigma-70 factor, ECF subfamily
MSHLLEAYRSARRTDDSAASESEPSHLESTLAALCARARAGHPTVELDDAGFVRHLARCGAAVAAGPDAVHAEDLFVAHAALDGNRAAIEKLQGDQRPAIVRYLRAVDATKTPVEEIEQRFWEEMLFGSAARHPKLANYSGKGPLSAFLGIVAQRMALDSRRRTDVEKRAVTRMAREVQALAGDAELALIKRRYKIGVQDAIREALGTLDDRERMIFRMHWVDSLSLHRIARVYGVTQSTVSRWIGKARESVLAETRRLLQERLLMSESEFNSIAGLLFSQLELSVSRILGRATGQ